MRLGLGVHVCGDEVAVIASAPHVSAPRAPTHAHLGPTDDEDNEDAQREEAGAVEKVGVIGEGRKREEREIK